MTPGAPPVCDLAAAASWLAASAPLDVAPLDRVLERQRDDGSWGAADDWRRRVLPTLWTVNVLAELGAASGPAWDAAARFLAARGTTDGGVFSRDGRRDGVLACYVGIAATTYLLGGRPDLAAPQVAWILRHQDVREHGVSRRGDVEPYHPALSHRYGGCFASTSCLVGVVKAGRALELWRRTGQTGTAALTGTDARDVDELLGVIRDALLARSLMRTGDGRVLPLGVPPARADEWLVPTFPVDWRTDLVEVLGLAARTGPYDERLQPAVDLLTALQRPDGGWPLLRSFWPTGFPALEPRSSRRSSRLATDRVVAALIACPAGTA
ncbi:hypothetical protein [Actinotalea subterranea]|uniref:hypothetical protein n=1 Tax=Actinotalea subterranea TaxID=2607497 RepID=UPI001FE41596|nr:hypothetical protein [Actinotalea subterranea]